MPIWLGSMPCKARTSTMRWASHKKPNRDRKSTRLNSSHLVISYAVFCLKKKKKTTRPTVVGQLQADRPVLRKDVPCRHDHIQSSTHRELSAAVHHRCRPAHSGVL